MDKTLAGTIITVIFIIMMFLSTPITNLSKAYLIQSTICQKINK